MTSTVIKKVSESKNKLINLSKKELEICSSFKDFFRNCCRIGFIIKDNYTTMKSQTISLFRTNHREVEIDNNQPLSEDELFDILSMYYDILVNDEFN